MPNVPNVNLKVGVLAVTVAIWAATAASAAEPVRSTEILVGPDEQQIKIQIQNDTAAFNLLPARIKAEGKVIAGLESNAGYPMSITKNARNYGLTTDLGNALAGALGVNITTLTMPFSGLIPSLDAGRIDFAPALFVDTAARREAVDFLDAAYALAEIFVLKKDSHVSALTIETACGHVVAANQGSIAATLLNDRSKKCEEEGKNPIDIKLFGNTAEALLAVKSDRVEGVFLGSSNARYMLRWDNEIKTGEAIGSKRGLLAIAFKKNSDLVPAFRAALLSLHKSGAWKEILAQYGSADAAPTLQVIENTKPVPASGPLP